MAAWTAFGRNPYGYGTTVTVTAVKTTYLLQAIGSVTFPVLRTAIFYAGDINWRFNMSNSGTLLTKMEYPVSIEVSSSIKQIWSG